MLIDFKLSSEEFKSKYQEKKPLIIKGAAETSAIRWSDIDDVISRCDAQSEGFRVSLPTGNVAKEKYIESYFHIGELRRKINKVALYDYLRGGATLVANSIYDEPIFNDFAKDIAQFVGRQTTTSAYIAFGNTDSYRAHWDSRDVFAVQLFGRKRWIVYEPSFDAPLYMHQSKFLEDQYPCPSEPYLDFVLEQGDVFYIPRGWWHNVSPLGESTVHLAIGTFPAFGVDYAKWIFGKLPDCIYARMALEDFQQDKPNIIALATHISAQMADPQNYQAFMESHFANQRMETRLNLETLGVPSVQTLDNDVTVRLNVLRTDLSENYWVTSTGKVWLKDELKPLMRYLVDTRQTTVGAVLHLFPDFQHRELREVLYSLASQGVVEITKNTETS